MEGPGLLERDGLLDQLRAHATAAARGSGRMVFVGGEAGAGKTSVVEALRPLLPPRTTFLYGACDPLSAPRPLAPLLDMAPYLPTQVRDLIASGGDRHELFTAVLDSLMRGAIPSLLVFEDLHWSDDATLDLLRFVGRRIEASRSMVLVTYRDDEVGTAHPVRRLLGDLARVTCVYRLNVPPLTVDAVRTLVGGTGRDPEQVHGRTGGNPYFVTEVLAMEYDGLPVKAGDAVLARAARLSPGALRTLQLCSLAKQHVDVSVLSQLTSPVEVDECCASGLLCEREGKLAFRHEIAREAVETSVPAATRRALHAELFRAFEAGSPSWLTGPDHAADMDSGDAAERAGRLAILAFHAHEADEGGAVFRYAVAAGRLALRLHAYREAHTQLSRALPHSRSMTPRDRARLFEDHARLCFLVDDMEGSAKSRRAAASLFQSAEDVEGQVRNLRELIPLLRLLGLAEQANDVRAHVDELAESLPEGSAELADVYNDRARPVPGAGAPDKAWLDLAAASAKASGNHTALAWSLTLDGFLLLLAGRVPAGRRRLASAVGVAADNGLEDVKVDLQYDAGALLSNQLRHRAAEAFLDEAIAVARNRDLDCTLNYATAAKARCDLYLGSWDGAATNAIWVLERGNASIVPKLRALVTLGLLRVRRGDPEADALLDEALELALRIANVPTTVAVRTARAEAALARDDHETALFEATVDLQVALDDGTPNDVAQFAYLMWKAGGTPQMPLPKGNPFSLQVSGRPLEAGHRWKRLGLSFEAARAYTESDDVPHLMEALRLFTELGAAPYRARTAERLRRLGARGVPRGPRPQTQANAAGLTSREMQVLRLLATGLRNADIAKHNHVSHRTVDNQVSSILAKLEAQSRGEAVAKAYEIGIIAQPAREREASRPSSAI